MDFYVVLAKTGELYINNFRYRNTCGTLTIKGDKRIIDKLKMRCTDEGSIIMHTYIIGKNTKNLIKDDSCPGVNLNWINLKEEEMGHMSCMADPVFYFVYMVRGAVLCQIDQECVEIRRGEGIFVNSNSLFRFAGGNFGDCEMYMMTIDTKVWTTEPVSGKYIGAILENDNISYLKLDVLKGNKGKLLESMIKIAECAKAQDMCWEMEVQSWLFKIFAVLYREYENTKQIKKKAVLRETDKLRRMLEYIHEHYKDKITLAEISENLGVSEGDYCRFFKKHMGQTPFEYLQAYRIEKSIPDLLNKSNNISEFSLEHGFNGSSYYTETFRKEMGCTPGDFRKWYLDEENTSCPLKKVRVGNQQAENKGMNQRKRNETMPTHLL